MAGPPPAKPPRRDPPRSTTIISNVAGKKVVSAVKSVVATIKRPTFIVEHLENRPLMTKMLNDLVGYIDHATEPANKSPLMSANILQDIVFTAGQTQYLKHGLGRPFVGFICISAFVADWSGRKVSLASAKLSASDVIGIRSTNAGQYSFLVF